jgi:hypothetical protein
MIPVPELRTGVWIMTTLSIALCLTGVLGCTARPKPGAARPRPWQLGAIAIVVLLFVTESLSAQTAVSIRVGATGSPNTQAAVEASLRVPIAGRISALADLGTSGALGACDQSWPGSFQCEYGGHFAAIGAAFGPVDTRHFDLHASASIGAFARSSFPDDQALSRLSAVGLELDLYLSRRVALVSSFRNVWLRDRFYRSLFETYPVVRVFTVGLGTRFR